MRCGVGPFYRFFWDQSAPYFSYSQSDDSSPVSKVKLQRTVKHRYSKSGLTEAMAAQIYQRLTRLMTEDKVYTNEQLNLNDLAQALEVHPNHISQVINEKTGGIYMYINSLRVEVFIRMATDEKKKKYTFLSLAYSCGFTAKSTLNKHFKQYTGTTPSE